MPLMGTKIWSLLVHIIFSVILAGVISSAIVLEFIYGWFAAVNILVFLSFGKDKFFAKMSWRRTPETTFLIMGLLGAFPAIFAGRKAFNHKTSKLGFIIPMWILFLGQLIGSALLVGDIELPKEATNTTQN